MTAKDVEVVKYDEEALLCKCSTDRLLQVKSSAPSPIGTARKVFYSHHRMPPFLIKYMACIHSCRL